MRRIRILLAAFAATTTCVSMLAQVPGTGAYPFASFDNRVFDSINLGNLNTRFTIPIVNKAGRGLSFNYAIQYEGLVWQAVSSDSTTVWTPGPNWGFTGLLNGTAFTGYLTHGTSVNTDDCPVRDGRSSSTQTFDNYVYHDAYGADHAFNYSYTTPCVGAGGGPTITGNGPATDGSGYSLVNGHLRTRNGTLITPGASSNGQDPANETDTNGNQITFNGSGTFTDTTGAPVLSISGSNPLTFTYPVTLQANNSTTASATLSYKTYTVRTNFGCSGITEYVTCSRKSLPVEAGVSLVL